MKVQYGHFLLAAAISGSGLLGGAAMPMDHDHSGSFQPMHCNMNLDSAQCVPFSSLNVDSTQKVTIDCGTCVIMDATGELALEGGLDVIGKLVFPSSRSALTITTPFVFVQGAFVVEPLPTKAAPQPDSLLEIKMVGTNDVYFTPHHNQTFDKCNGGGCNQSKKPFIVAGGYVDIQGLDDSCHTWSRLQSVSDAGTPVLTSTESAPQPLQGCSPKLIDESFDVHPVIGWDGINGVASTADGVLTVSDPARPRVHLPVECITPNAHYLLKFKFRYRHTSTSDSFVPPYINMIQYMTQAAGGGNHWHNHMGVYSRGQVAAARVDTWYEMQAVLQFDDVMADPSQTEDLSLYIAPYSNVDTIDIDDFVLELSPADAYDQTCDSLLVNGDTALSDGHAYPFYPTGGLLHVVSSETGPTGTPFFRNTLRYSTWSSALSQDISTECVKKAAVYDFSAWVRVHSPDIERVVSFSLWTTNQDGGDFVGTSIVTCPPSTNEWVHCTSKIRLEEDADEASVVKLYTRVLGDDTSDLDVADVSFTYVGGRAASLTLEDSSSAACWAPGAEILVTSHTIQHTDSQVAIIDSVDSNGVITLVDPIHKPISLDDDPMQAVEVALLSRNVIFSSSDDDVDDPLHGAHFIVLHTSAPVVQNIVGVENRGNGQQGKLGKYPFHFHMCASVSGSSLSKNTIRNTKQRGIVVHGSNDLNLYENILYDTRGHAVMLEDGAETGNVFERNVGAVGHGVDIRISDDESDPTPSTFWITNPQNTWIGNVAAGSQFSGFWFEVKTRVRGPSFNMHQDMIPNQLDLRTFTDNVSHSNSQGLQTYPQTGYRPENLAVFRNHKSYRNRRQGIFFHAGGRLSIDGGYISDNKIGIDIDADHSDVISNTVIIGTSPVYRAVIEAIGAKASQYPATSFCDANDDTSPLVGVRLDSFHDGSLFAATGSHLSNVTFSGFGSQSCIGSSALHVDSEDIRYFDTRNKVENIHVLDDSTRINLCGGEKQVAIHDVDGSLGGEPGFIISDDTAIRAHPDCTTISETSCAAFCPGICLRTMTVLIPSYHERGSLTLQVTGTTAEGEDIVPIFVKDFQNKPMAHPIQDLSHGRLFVTLPAGGSYQGVFLSDGNPVWPHYADLNYEDQTGNCGPDFASFDIEKPIPDQCDSLISNGDFEAGSLDFWWYAGLYGIEVSDEGADGSSKSLLAPNPVDGGGRHVGSGQFLDTRCIEEGYIYSLSAKVKLVDSSTGELYQCNLSGYTGDENPCLSGNLRFTNRLGEQHHSWELAGTMTSNNTEWNLMSGSYVANAYDAAAYQAYLYFTGVPAGINIQIDDVSFLRSAETEAPTARPTNSPTLKPTKETSSQPTSSPLPSFPSPFEGSNTDSVIFGDDSIQLVTESSVDSTVLTKEAHTGDFMLTVEIESRTMVGSGYQPQLVLFFAPQTTSIADVTTNDNGFGNYFEPSVAAWFKEKIYFDPSNPTSLWHTFFNAQLRGVDGNFVSKSAGKNIRMTSGFLRIQRSGGSVECFYSFDDSFDEATWTSVGGAVALPASYQTSPLKLGYRILREYKSSYDIFTRPTIVSDGTSDPNAAAGPQSYFVDTNTERIGATCGLDGCTMALDAYNSIMLSTESFLGDVSITVKVENREIFGTGYQSGLALFFASAEDTIDAIPSGNGQDGAFESHVLAVVRDKIHATINHTWMSMKTQTDGGLVSQGGGDGWKNVEGYLKLTRTGDVVTAFMSPNGNGWAAIGGPTTLPANYSGAPIKIGMRTFRNWCSSYSITVMSVVEN